MELNLRLLRYFVAVVDEGHFGRAAAKLFISTPALTQQIRRLERQLGFSLLDRTTRPVRPTPAGAAFLPEARALLVAADRASAVARAEARLVDQRFALGFAVTPLGRLTRGLLDEFARRGSPGTLQLVELPLAEQTAAVATGEVDASFAWAPVDAPGLRVEHAVSTPRMLAVPIDHPLNGRHSLGIGDIGREPYVDLAHDTLGERWARWWAVDPRPDGSEIRYTEAVRTIGELLEAVANGRGVTIVSEVFADSYARRDLAFVHITDIDPTEIVLCTRPGDTSALTGLLRELVRDLDVRAGRCS